MSTQPETKTSAYLENMFINHLVRNTSFTPPTKVYIALYASNPGDYDNGLEINISGSDSYSGSYARVEWTNGFWFANSGSTSNASPIIFYNATEDWSLIRYFGIRTGSQIGTPASNGSLLFYGQFSASKSIKAGDNFTIPVNGLKIYLNDYYSIHAANKLLNHTLKNDSWASPGTDVYASLYYITPDRNNLNKTEISGSLGYARVKVGGSGSWTSPTNGVTQNASPIIFISPAAQVWGTINGAGLCVAPTGGSLLFRYNFKGAPAVVVGDHVMFDTGNFHIRLNYNYDAEED